MKFAKFIALLVIFSACGNIEQRKTVGPVTKECVDEQCTSMFDVTMKKADRVIAQRQLLPNYKKCLGLTNAQVSTTTMDTFAASTPALSMDGNPQDLNNAMLLAATKVASEICNDLINAEKPMNKRNYFGGFTLGGTGDGVQTFDAPKTLNKFSNACWGRDITVEERQLLVGKFSSSTITKDAKGALLICTIMLSSADALRY